jgi:peptidoglycan/LPS O-acetylase OafA/YrhL
VTFQIALEMNPRKHILALDGIRGIAIVLVMSRHFAEPFLDRGPDVALGGIVAIDRIF